MLAASARLRAKGEAATRAAVVTDVPLMQRVADFITARDFGAAAACLEFAESQGLETLPNATGGGSAGVAVWLAYCYFHAGEYEKAASIYRRLLLGAGADPTLHVNLACCLYQMGRYEDADAEAALGPPTTLRNRVALHCATQRGDEARAATCTSSLKETYEDQLSLAAVHYHHGRYQEAIDIYARVTAEQPAYLAVHAYAAMCHYRLDYYDAASDALALYTASTRDSSLASVIKACVAYKQYSGEVALAELAAACDGDPQDSQCALIRHNAVVFANGENARQVLAPLVDVLPDARLNLAIHHLRADEVLEAFELVRAVQPTAPQDYILKGVANAAVGQLTDSPEHLRVAQSYFHLVGTSASEMDTIPGRQCLASAFILLKQFDDALTYLQSIRTFFHSDDAFNLNFGVASIAAGSPQQGRDALLRVGDTKLKSSFYYIAWLARAFLLSSEAKRAWDLYLRVEAAPSAFSLLQLIAADAYRTGQFAIAAKAYDALEQLDPNPEYWEGKRGACAGVLQLVVANRVPPDALREVLTMLGRSRLASEAEQVARVIRTWAKSQNVRL